MFEDSQVVIKYLKGNSPQTEKNWRRVATTLHELHRLTRSWPLRPGWRS